MKRRWFIRGLFMLPILLCIVGWGWSYAHEIQVAVDSGSEYWLMIRRGTCYVGFVSEVAGHTSWTFVSRNSDHYGHDKQMGRHFLGFSVNNTSEDRTYSAWEAGIPFWFMAILFSVALFVVWRKTRPKPQSGAFPVEVKAKA